MGVLEKFFQIAMVLTVMVIAINGFLITFGPSLIGQNVQAGEQALTDGTSADITSTVQQQTVDRTTPASDQGNWGDVLTTFNRMFFEYQTVIGGMFENLDPTQTGDELEGVGALIIGIISMFQIIGAAYIGFAVLSAFTGGGSP